MPFPGNAEFFKIYFPHGQFLVTSFRYLFDVMYFFFSIPIQQYFRTPLEISCFYDFHGLSWYLQHVCVLPNCCYFLSYCILQCIWLLKVYFYIVYVSSCFYQIKSINQNQIYFAKQKFKFLAAIMKSYNFLFFYFIFIYLFIFLLEYGCG